MEDFPKKLKILLGECIIGLTKMSQESRTKSLVKSGNPSRVDIEETCLFWVYQSSCIKPSKVFWSGSDFPEKAEQFTRNTPTALTGN
ncbi:hypothetical protein J2X69_004839 [Algoriphagus sp. 4150]|nr:hypothetical protein [Algoriphagus sp. 4150]